MDWTLVIFFSFLVIATVLIVITLASLPQLGDERKVLIKMKAQSYTFTVIIGFSLLKIIESIYLTFQADKSSAGIDPFTFLLGFSIFYLCSLLYFKKKYGG